MVRTTPTRRGVPEVDEVELAAIEARLAAVAGEDWEPAQREGLPVVLVRFADGCEGVMRVTRDGVTAGEDDIEFIGRARRDIGRLLAEVRGDGVIAETDLDDIGRRCSRASPPPWRVFLERDGGIGGSNVIWVSDRDDEPDLYVWLDGELARDADFEFIAAARQDVPVLLAAARQHRE